MIELGNAMPLMPGTASPGDSGLAARQNHVHPNPGGGPIGGPYAAYDLSFITATAETGLTNERVLTGSGSIQVSDGTTTITLSVIPGGISHSALANLLTDSHTIYALLAGRALGQSFYGGTAASETLSLYSTVHSTKGKINFGTDSAYDEANGVWGFGTTSPSSGYRAHVSGSNNLIRLQNTDAGGDDIVIAIGDTALEANMAWMGAPYGTDLINNYVYGLMFCTNQVGSDIFQARYGSTSPKFKVTSAGQTRIAYDGTHYTDLTPDVSGNLTIAPTADLILDPVGNDVLPATTYDINLGNPYLKYRSIHAAELQVETLVAKEVISTIGGRILVAPTTYLTRDLTAVANIIYVKHNEAAPNDVVYMQSYDTITGSSKLEFLQILTGPITVSSTAPDTEYYYTVTRAYGSGTSYAWYAGNAVLNSGVAGDGFIDIYSEHGVKSTNEYGPSIIGNVRNSVTYNDWTSRWALGNLNGLYGYATTAYGVALGEYAASKSHITIDSTDGIRFYKGLSTRVGEFQLDGDIFLGTDTSAAATTNLAIFNVAQAYNGENVDAGDLLLGDNTASKANVYWDKSTGRLNFRGGTTTQAYIDTNGKIIAGSGTVTLDTSGIYLQSDALAGQRLKFGPDSGVEASRGYLYWFSGQLHLYNTGGSNTSGIILSDNGAIYFQTGSGASSDTKVQINLDGSISCDKSILVQDTIAPASGTGCRLGYDTGNDRGDIAAYNWSASTYKNLCLRCSEVIPKDAGVTNLGNAVNYWNDIQYKTLTDAGCFGSFDSGVEMPDGRILTDLEALRDIKVDTAKMTIYGVPRLDYSTMPKVVYRPAKMEGKPLPRDADGPYYIAPYGAVQRAEDGAELSALVSIILGAIKELAAKQDILIADVAALKGV